MFYCKSNYYYTCWQIHVSILFHFISSLIWVKYSWAELLNKRIMYFFSILVLPWMFLRRQKKQKRVSLFRIKLSYKLCYAVFLMLATLYFISLKSHSICIWKTWFLKMSFPSHLFLFLSISVHYFLIVTVVYFSKTTFDFPTLFWNLHIFLFCDI